MQNNQINLIKIESSKSLARIFTFVFYKYWTGNNLSVRIWRCVYFQILGVFLSDLMIVATAYLFC